MPATMSQADVAAQARAFFDGNLAAGQAVVIDGFSATRDMNTGVVTVTASGHLKTSLLGAVDVSSIEFGATTTAQSGSKNLEVVMALDNTGSMGMGTGKIEALIEAANELVDDLSANVTGEGQLKIGMVPFATDVRVDFNDPTYAEADWIDFSKTDVTKTCSRSSRNFDQNGARFSLASFHPDGVELAWGGGGGWGGGGWGGGGGSQTCTTRTWNGCITDRDSPNNASDAAVVTTDKSTQYPAVPTCPNNLAFVQPMTTDFASLKTEIDTMNADGNTNVTIGAAWGLALLSQQAPFTEGVAYSDKETEKFLIILTDGANTGDKFATCNSRGLDMSCVTRMNNQTLAVCTAAKDAGITVYTIGVMLDTTKVDGAAADAMLASCASDSSHYLPVTSASQLVPTFLGIAKSIENLRITS
jgi:hypothetical protein